jgi:hypothetical protein
MGCSKLEDDLDAAAVAAAVEELIAEEAAT